MSEIEQVRVPRVVGVVGAGTMGAGVAQLAAQAGARTILHDPDPAALERGLDAIAAGVRKLAEKGRLPGGGPGATIGLVEPAGTPDAMAACDLVVEAAPEGLTLKRDLFAQLAQIVGEECVLATNTSSLSVTAIAAGVPHPERVVGLHFFNPAPVMRLAEVVRGVATSDATAATARALGEAMGKHVIDAADIPGFLVNRVNRPFFLEALRILQEQVADVEQIDRIVRMAGGFRMGPFELMDLIGIETNHAVAEGFYDQTYGEPRYRPSPLAARMVAAGRLGRKTGEGWYRYGDDAPPRPPDPEPGEPGGGDGRILAVTGDLPVLDELREAAASAGFDVRGDEAADDAWLVVDGTGRTGSPEGARLVALHAGSLHRADPRAAGFHAIAPLDAARLVELTRTPRTRPVAAARAEELVRCLGRHPEWVGDTPGLVLGRLVATLANEAAFLIGEGNGTPEDVDAGLELGVNHPRGPVAWAELTGEAHLEGLLDALFDELHDERYRVAPLLRRSAALDGVPA